MQDKIRFFLDRYNEAIQYIFFGVLTVLINTLTFLVFDHLGLTSLWANTISFFIAVQFAYFTNTKFVFKTTFTKKNFIQFWGMRIGTIFVDNIGLIMLLTMGYDKLVAKLFVNGIIIVLNYICSKFYIYKKRD